MIWSGFREVWAYRGFILGSVKREFQVKYKNSFLGGAWAVINPMSMIIVYTVVFSQIMKARLPGVDNMFGFSVYLCSGLLTWGLFSEILLLGKSTFIDNSNLMKKMNFPKICLPITVVSIALVNFSIIFSLFSIFLVLTNSFPGLVIFSFFPVVAVLLILAFGISLVVSVVNVFIRDVGQLFNVLIQFWFWATPIIYPVNIIPDRLQWVIRYNPMTNIITTLQNIFVKQQWPVWLDLIYPLIVGVVCCIVGISLFKRLSNEIVDEI